MLRRYLRKSGEIIMAEMGITLSSEMLENLHAKQLAILRSVVKVIEELGLRYFCVGGTALGAIKYQGFIPWDDDIDIAMPRQDFMLFLQRGPTLLPKHLFVQSVYSEKEYCLSVAKVRDINTTYFDISTAALNVCHGVFIDVFPIDGYTEQKSRVGSLMWKLRENKITWSNYFKPVYPTFTQRMIGLISRSALILETPNRSCQKNEKLLMKEAFDDSNLVYMRTEVFAKDIFGRGNEAMFGNMPVIVPEKVEEYLSLCYGDIALDPPPEKQYPHHFALAVDCQTPFTEFVFSKGKLIRKRQ